MDKLNIYINSDGEEVRQTTSHKALVFRDKKLLMSRNEYSGEFCVPGGREQVDETPEDALLREIAEESRLKCFRLLSTKLIQENAAVFRWHADQKLRHIDQKWYLCELKIEDPIDPEGIQWMTYEQAAAVMTREAERQVLEKIKTHFE